MHMKEIKSMQRINKIYKLLFEFETSFHIFHFHRDCSGTHAQFMVYLVDSLGGQLCLFHRWNIRPRNFHMDIFFRVCIWLVICGNLLFRFNEFLSNLIVLFVFFRKFYSTFFFYFFFFLIFLNSFIEISGNVPGFPITIAKIINESIPIECPKQDSPNEITTTTA